ncbi:NADPH-dependent diflavin oxidoreductase 1 [Phlyctema vagabunda]|uniref:NADPH-dependent diflavin oxidoreductase 1 n=1 Tax=Phlyctema vagabunda TaxID=108571 RepID=A0ABR4PAQ9_9HELO
MAIPGQQQPHERTALILYGSETGKSEDAAEDVARMARRLHFVTRVCEMDLVEINQLPQYTVVVLLLSTTGQGEFPRNARTFWKSLLRKRLPPGCLGHVSFTTFGLGDSSYPKYNWSARKLHKRIQQLGAREIYARGEGDEQHEDGIDGTFINWMADLRSHLLSTYPLPVGLEPIPKDVFLAPTYILELRTPLTELLLSNEDDVVNGKFSDSVEPADIPMLAQLPEVIEQNIEEQYHKQPQTLDCTQQPKVSAPPTVESSANMIQSILLPEVVTNESNAGDGPQLKGPPTDKTECRNEVQPENVHLPIPQSFFARMVANIRITPEDHWQDVRELTFYVQEGHNYHPGDTLTLYPKNFPEDVNALIDLMQWSDVADMELTDEIEPHTRLDAPSLFPALQHPHCHAGSKWTLRKLLTHNLDITAIPKRSFFDAIAFHTKDEMHQTRLREFADPSFTDEFYDYATRPRRSILEVLQDFPSVKLPWKYATAYFPFIRGREYSIASGGVYKKIQPAMKGYIQIQLLVALVQYKTVLRKTRQGLCSRYLASLPGNTVVRVSLKHNEKFYDPVRNNPHRPVILIGTGTGLAPLRALMWERRLNIATLQLRYDFPIARSVLFFGNRNRDADFFYANEYTPDALDADVFSCFSRDQRQKIYVQDLIRQQSAMIMRAIDAGAAVYVCGSSGKMPEAVRRALVDVIEERKITQVQDEEDMAGGTNPVAVSTQDADKAVDSTREKAERFFGLLEKQGRFIQETW